MKRFFQLVCGFCRVAAMLVVHLAIHLTILYLLFGWHFGAYVLQATGPMGMFPAMLQLALAQIPVIHADSFGSTNDAWYCEFIPAIGVFRGDTSVVPQAVEFNASAIKGLHKSRIPTLKLQDLANIYVGTLGRYKDVASRVSVAPGMQVFLGFYGYNFAGHNVTVHKVFIPVDFPGQGWYGLLDQPPVVSRSVTYINRGVAYTRTGRFLVFEPKKTFKNNTSYAGVSLGSVRIKQPIKILENSLECSMDTAGNQTVEHTVCVQNTGGFAERIRLFDSTYTLSSNAKICKTRINAVSAGSPVASASQKLTVLDSKTGCLSFTAPRGDYNSAVHKSVFVLRDDASFSLSWRGFQPGLTTKDNLNNKTLCITRIPYKLRLEPKTCNFPISAQIRQESIACVSDQEHMLVTQFSVKNTGILIKNLNVRIYVKNKPQITPPWRFKRINSNAGFTPWNTGAAPVIAQLPFAQQFSLVLQIDTQNLAPEDRLVIEFSAQNADRTTVLKTIEFSPNQTQNFCAPRVDSAAHSVTSSCKQESNGFIITLHGLWEGNLVNANSATWNLLLATNVTQRQVLEAKITSCRACNPLANPDVAPHKALEAQVTRSASSTSPGQQAARIRYTLTLRVPRTAIPPNPGHGTTPAPVKLALTALVTKQTTVLATNQSYVTIVTTHDCQATPVTPTPPPTPPGGLLQVTVRPANPKHGKAPAPEYTDMSADSTTAYPSTFDVDNLRHRTNAGQLVAHAHPHFVNNKHMNFLSRVFGISPQTQLKIGVWFLTAGLACVIACILLSPIMLLGVIIAKLTKLRM